MRILRWIVGPLVAAAASSAIADRNIGNWTLGAADDGAPYMYVESDSGAYFGKWCDMSDATCFWLVANRTPCDMGMRADALLATDKGVEGITIQCAGPLPSGGLPGYYRYIIEAPDLLDAAIPGAIRISVVMALEGDSFKVFRFPAAGSAPAFDRWTKDAVRASEQRRPRTKDVTL